LSPAKTIAFGGVETGRVKAIDEERAAAITEYTIVSCPRPDANPTDMTIDINAFAEAVLEATWVKPHVNIMRAYMTKDVCPNNATRASPSHVPAPL
jgi:hypothetical protein